MMNGAACIASNLPGVRQPVLRHKMGYVIPIGDANALAAAILKLSSNSRKKTSTLKEKIEDLYAPDTIAKEYERLFASIFTQI